MPDPVPGEGRIVVEAVPCGEIKAGDAVLVTGQLGLARKDVFSTASDDEDGCVLSFIDADSLWFPSRDYDVARVVPGSVQVEGAEDVAWAPFYLPLDCPKCGRHRLEYGFRAGVIVVRCEKCGANSDDDTLAAARLPDLPDDLRAVLGDPGITIRQDGAVFDLIAKWLNAPSATESGVPDA